MIKKMSFEKLVFFEPQEVWDKEKCEEVCKRTGGTPYKGFVQADSSPYPKYGEYHIYNGGFTAPDGNWYKAIYRPMPEIPPGYEFYKILSWGTYLRKK